MQEKNDSIAIDILSSLIVYMKYARYLPEKKRRETWQEIVDRYCQMHMEHFPLLVEEIKQAKQFISDKKVLPSMRGLQFAGKAIEVSPNRSYNCSALAIDHWEAFSEIMFLLLGGSGCGFSVQKHHVAQLPEIRPPLQRTRRFLIEDSIEGWAEAIRTLVRTYFLGLSRPRFDFSIIREKGTPLKTSGGKAPGPQPLKDCIYNLTKIFDSKKPGDKLKTIEVYDIINHIADAVLAGGIRRAALLALFSLDDEEMLNAKHGNWWETNPQRGRSNNSVAILRHKITKKVFFSLWERIKLSDSGEPGFFFTNDREWLINPCQPADASVLTPNGISTIGEISAGDLVWTGKKWAKVSKKWSTGIKEVWEYHTSAGTFLGTENHRVVSNGIKTKVKHATTIDTAQGPVPNQHSFSTEEDLILIMDGLVLGDGSIHKASNDLIGLYIGNDDQDYFNSEVKKFIIKHRPGINPKFYEIETNINRSELPYTYLRKVPERYLHLEPYKQCLFLRGLFSANGSICGNRITLKTTSFDIVKNVQLMLSAVGIKSYYTKNAKTKVRFCNGEYETKESYDINISTDRSKFGEYIGFIQKYKNNKLNSILLQKERKPKLSYEIKDTNYRSTEEVFDIMVDDDEHTYWTGGLLVSNCSEVSLKSNQFCNLCTINANNIESQEDLNNRARAAAFFGTLQAAYTDFHYIRDIWQQNTKKDALLGVSLTGIASGKYLNCNLEEATNIIKEENKRISQLLNINYAKRLTVIKPEGSSSLVLGCSSGIHAWYSPYYIRRIRLLKTEAIYKYLKKKLPALIENDYFQPTTQAILSIPVKAPNKAIYSSENSLDLLERIKYFNINWIQPGHIDGENTNNVSATVYVKPHEWEIIGNWIWENKKFFNGLTILPSDTKHYKQPPFEKIVPEKYEELVRFIKEIDLTEVEEEEDNTELKQEPACAGGACEISI